MAVDMFLLAFQTRDCRGGKGERSLFLKLYLELAARFPETAKSVLPLIPKYGYYKDLFLIAEKINENDSGKLASISDEILSLAARQLETDLAAAETAITTGKPPKNISLLAKWAPREKSSQKSLAKLLAEKMFPGNPAAKAQYRKVISRLNILLNTVEVKMCGHAWEEIEPTSVPSVSLMRHRKAFLNEKLKGVPSTIQEKETGNRFPDDETRVTCRKRVREAMVSTGLKKLKGKQLFPHEISKEIMNHNKKSETELEIFDAQWKAIRKGTQEALASKMAESQAADSSSKPIDLGKLVALVDVSGSMSGIPMEVAIALGILVSELADPAFANRVITFHEKPTWCTFEADGSIAEKVTTAKRAPWGGSTNFEAAMELILDVAVKAKLTPEEIPNLIVFSDMQFNVADRAHSGTWTTHHERLVHRFAEAGVKVCGRPYPIPEMTYWNLRGNTVGFPVDANAPNVRMLSGFSPSLLKLILDGEPLQVEVEQEEITELEGGGVVINVVKKKVAVDPMTTLRKALDDACYDEVRVALSASNEGVLESYTFIPPVVAEAVEGKGAAMTDADEWEEVESS